MARQGVWLHECRSLKMNRRWGPWVPFAFGSRSKTTAKSWLEDGTPYIQYRAVRYVRASGRGR